MGTPLRVLIVEDSEDDALLAVRELQRAGFEPTWERVESAGATTAALDKQEWDVVISDHRMPNFSSADALALTKRRGLDVPFIIVSGSIGEDLAVEAMKAGASDYILKGNLKRLAAAVTREVREVKARRAHREAEVKQREAEEKYRILVEEIPAVTYIAKSDEIGSTVYISPQVEAVTGYPVSVWRADPGLWVKTLHPDDRDRVLAEYRQSCAGGAPFVSEYRLLTRDGRVVWVRDDARVVREQADQPPVVHGFRVDITARKQAEETILHLAFHDRLTGLPNAARLLEDLREAIAEAKRRNLTLALLAVNLNSFREITNTIGKHNGDRVIKDVTQRIRSVLQEQEEETLAHVGWDEFAVMLRGADAARAGRAAERVLKSLEAAFVLDALPIEIEATIGIALFPGHGEEAEVLIQRADIALNEALRQGRGWALYSFETDPYNPRQLILMGELRSALENDQIFLHYQPKVDLKEGGVTGVEALVRWRHPSLGLVPPGQFIPIAEKTGLIHPLTRWVLNEVLRQLRVWQREGSVLTVAANLSARNLQDPRLPEKVEGMLATWGAAPGGLILEITESALMVDLAHAKRALDWLNSRGIGIALDDFGTGYSSLGNLRKLPFTEIKVDQTFVRGLTSKDADAQIVRSTVELGHNLGLKVVAEGVEDRTTLDTLKSLGCDAAQGFYIGRPMGVDDLSRWLTESPWGAARKAARSPDA